MAEIGDIRYSILEPSKFTELNGHGWVVPQGQEITGSRLHQITGISRLPDMRGMFLRSLNLGRTTGGDPDLTRQVGSFQDSSNKKHSHLLFKNEMGSANNGGPRGNKDSIAAGATHYAHAQYNISPVGGEPNAFRSSFDNNSDESRPKNIATFVYIKIDENG